MASKEHVGTQFRNILSPYDDYGSWFTIPHPESDQVDRRDKGTGPHFVDPFGGGSGAYG